MPAPTRDAQVDGFSGIRRGMDSGTAPRLLPPQQLAFAINVTCRGGLPRTRPVWRKMAVEYESEEARVNATAKLWQAAGFYRAVGQGENCIVASIGGRLFRFTIGGAAARVQDISIAGDLNSSVNPDCWMWQAEDFLIVQNGQANPLFFDGAGVRRSKGMAGEELPAGCMGVYVQGRVWQSEPNRQSFIGGDLVYSHGFTGPYNGRDAVLKTTENTFLSGGGSFPVPITAGKITAMAMAAVPDTSLGQGSLQVMTQLAVFSVQTPFLREDWPDTQFPLMVVGLPNYGAVGQRAVTAVNGDLWYRSLDGLRSYQIARRDFNTWVNTPLSEEMRRVLTRDVGRWLERGSAVLFDNRLLVTCSPYAVRGRGIAHRGLVALDFDNISGLTNRDEPPAYDGLWTGLPILQLVKGLWNGVERCFAFALDCDEGIVLYELTVDGAGWFDWDGEETVGVESSLETRAMGWRDGGNALKKLLCADLYMDRVAGNDTLRMEAQYRSDEDPIWKDWHNWTMCAPVRDCTTAGCPTFQDVREQYRTYLRLPDPRDTPCSELTRRSPRTGYEFQLRLWWKGFVQWNRVHAWAKQESDSVVQVCPTSETCQLVKGCDENWFAYSIEDCAVPPPGPEMVGIIWEDIPEIWMTTEEGVVMRTEDQPQFPGGAPPPALTGACTIGGVCAAMAEADCLAAGGVWAGAGTVCGGGGGGGSPPYTLPEWPAPAPYPCAGQAYSAPIQMADPVTLVSRFVGINPGAGDPNAYMAAFGAAGALEAWAAAVWADFLASGVAYSQARLVWGTAVTSGDGWMGTEVFPAQAGNYHPVINLDVKIVTEYCP